MTCKIICALLALIACNNLVAVDNIHDVFTGQGLEVSNRVTKYTPTNKQLKQEIEIVSLYITANKPVYNTINAKALELCKYYTNNEKELYEIDKELVLRLAVYNKIKYSSNYYRGSMPDIRQLQLSEVRSEPISMVAGMLFFEVVLEFSLPNQSSYNESEEFLISFYYTADLATGNIKKFAPKISAAQNKLLQQHAADKMKGMDNLEVFKERNDYDDYFGDEEPDTEKKKSVELWERIDFKNAAYYWFAWGVKVDIQAYSPNSEMLYGKPFSFFIPLEQVKKIFNNTPEFAFVNKLNIPATSISAFNLIQVRQQLVEMRSNSTIETILNLNGVKYFPDTFKTVEEEPLVWCFTPAGKMVSKIRYNSRYQAEYEEYFEYDANGQVLTYQTKSRGGSNSRTDYRYDAKKNLVEKTYIERNETAGHTYYFYVGDNIYYFDWYFFEGRRNNPIEKVTFTNNKLCMGDVCYQLNKNGQIEYITAGRYAQSNQAQIARDNKGRVIEEHRDNDRYNQYYTYDEQGRLVKYEYMEYQDPRETMVFEYTGNSPIPSKKSSTNTQWGNNRVVVETYQAVYLR